MNSPFAGVWHYRSFLNDPGTVTPDNLLFGEGMFTFADSPVGTLTGSADFGSGLTMKFKGASALGNPMSLRFQGIGTGKQNSDWVYDYVGWLVPAWPNGVNQVDAIAGSVVRTMPHSNGQAKAGVVVSFYAVRKS
ncbi:MAG: hypothetical protein QOJ39_397 [Candidatus Eremiobacteraeota bacterium]|jgi:hypothetical protein|nr:hypothetical protein [Candidatus Eremiobacteraeota bacterium]